MLARERRRLRSLFLRKEGGKPSLLFCTFCSVLLLQLIINGSVFRSVWKLSLFGSDDNGQFLFLPQQARTQRKVSLRRAHSKHDYVALAQTKLYHLLQENRNKTHTLKTITSKDGTILYNPQAFRTRRHDYVNLPTPCSGCSTPRKQTKPSSTLPGRVLQHSPTPPPLNRNVVMAYLARWEHGSSTVLQQFIGSLRRTGYTGHILLGFPEAGAKTTDWEYLQAHNVTTIYNIDTCNDGKDECDEGPARLLDLQASWLQACVTCTGWVLSATQLNGVYFQTDPFAGLATKKDNDMLLLAEEMGPHTDPFHTATTTTTSPRHTLWSNQRSVSAICFPKFPQLLQEKRPILLDTMVLGTRDTMLQFYARTRDYYHGLAANPACKDNEPSQLVVNYLYYTNEYTIANKKKKMKVTTTPWGTGPVLSLARACSNAKLRPSIGQYDMIDLDEESGHLVNIHNNDRLWRLPPILIHTQSCTLWMRRYFDLHERWDEYRRDAPALQTRTSMTSLGSMIRRAMNREIGHSQQHPKAAVLPMKTSYHRATVVKRASWFDASQKAYCRETCCAEPIAVSMDQDADHLITSVDGFDLADVALLGHHVKPHLTLDVSYMDDAIIPCLRQGTIFYADSEGGGILRFFERFRPNLTQPFVLITGRTDGPEPITGGGGVAQEAIKNDKLMTRWYGINPCYTCGADSDKFAMMHLGLSAMFDHQRYLYDYVAERNFINPFSGANKAKFTQSTELKTANDTTTLLFTKFGINAHSKHRQKVFDMACTNRTDKPKDTISCSTGDKKFHPSDIYETAQTYLFGVSPPGNGKDCYRTYEFLYLGVIPVVLWSPEFEELFKDLPVLMLQSWDYTQPQLVHKMSQYVNSDAFRNNDFKGWERLFLQYWRNRVLSDAGRLDEIVEDDMGRPYYQAWSYRAYTPPLSYQS